MTIHVSLASKNIVNLFVGTAEAAQKGWSRAAGAYHRSASPTATGQQRKCTVSIFRSPLLMKSSPVALMGTKGTWYDHTVSVSNPIPAE